MTDPVDSAAVLAALSTVSDPEHGINIVDLGLVYGVDVAPGQVTVRLTLTSPGCPMGNLILGDAEEAVQGVVTPGTVVDLELVWEPPWGPERMSDAAKQHFGWD